MCVVCVSIADSLSYRSVERERAQLEVNINITLDTSLSSCVCITYMHAVVYCKSTENATQVGINY